MKAADICNYLGYDKISGPELGEKFKINLEKNKIEVKTGERVKVIKPIDGGFSIQTSQNSYEAKTILITSGKSPRRLNVPGEEEFLGKGVSYCATCDAPLFHNKSVVVIGGGNSALDAALEIEKYAQKVTIINLTQEVRGDEVLKDKFAKSPKCATINNAKTTEVLGDGLVKGIKYEDSETKEIKELPCEGVFVEIGWEPSTNFIKDSVKLNKLNEIEIDCFSKTSCEGIYAAGDVTDTPYKQIIIAAGDGAKAALSIWKYLLTKK
jgi:alkyl hydroperoxide reductase subunit F